WAGGASGSGAYVGAGGATVQYGERSGAVVGPLGGARAGHAEGVRVTTPGGETYTRASRGGVAVGPGGGAVAGHSAAVFGPWRNAVPAPARPRRPGGGVGGRA